MVAGLLFLSGYLWVRAEREGRHGHWSAVAVWAGSLCVKPTTLVAAPAFVRCGKTKAVAIGLAAVVALSAPYLLIMQSDPSCLWRHASFGLAHSGNLGLRALLQTAAHAAAGQCPPASAPPLPPPRGRSTKEHFQVIQAERALTSERLTSGWNRIPPLKGPRALLN